MAPHPQAVAKPASNDIIFECPFCDKSLAIDARGSGMVITCPDCGKQIQVPGLLLEERVAAAAPPLVVDGDPQERIKILCDELALSQSKVERLVANLEEVRDRRTYLEKLRSDNMGRFEQIAKEMGVIQNSVDRVLTLLQDAAAEHVAPSDETPPVGGKPSRS
ncbi:MAG: hypothetical protein V1873_08715 [Verrucomicrobiota bacterium]